MNTDAARGHTRFFLQSYLAAQSPADGDPVTSCYASATHDRVADCLSQVFAYSCEYPAVFECTLNYIEIRFKWPSTLDVTVMSEKSLVS